jgi:hypothetical protein
MPPLHLPAGMWRAPSCSSEAARTTWGACAWAWAPCKVPARAMTVRLPGVSRLASCRLCFLSVCGASLSECVSSPLPSLSPPPFPRLTGTAAAAASAGVAADGLCTRPSPSTGRGRDRLVQAGSCWPLRVGMPAPLLVTARPAPCVTETAPTMLHCGCTRDQCHGDVPRHEAAKWAPRTRLPPSLLHALRTPPLARLQPLDLNCNSTQVDDICGAYGDRCASSHPPPLR